MQMPAANELSILFVEDSALDVKLSLHELKGLGRKLSATRVSDAEALRDALTRSSPDVILSDFSMPGFSGMHALEIVRELAPEIPFIFVSGTIGEEAAIEALQQGAVDYVLKENLRRLQPAVERALRTAATRRQMQDMQRALRESEERFRTIVETTEDWVWEMDLHCIHNYVNSSVMKILGYPPDEVIGRDALALMVDEDRAEVEQALPKLLAVRKGWHRWTLRWRHRDGSIRVLESTANPVMDHAGVLTGYRGVDRDVTERVQQEAKIRHLARIHAVLSALGNAVLRSRDTSELLDQSCRLAVVQGGFEAAAILVRTSASTLSVASSFGEPAMLALLARPDALHPDPAGPGASPFSEALRTASMIVTRDGPDNGAPSGWPAAMARVGIAAQISLPIGAETWGVMSLFARVPQAFDADEIELLKRLTDEVDYARDFLAKSERLEFLAYNNPTTSLPNRTALRDLLLSRLEDGPQVIAMIDIERFRYFNRTRGRRFGDALLREVGARLQSLTPEGAVLAHPGDDAFVLAIAQTDGDGDARAIEALLNRCTAQPFMIQGEQVHARFHCSVLMAPLQAQTPDTIEHGLVAALAEAKALDHPLLAYTEGARQRMARQVTLERDLRRALGNREFELHLQPKYNAVTRQLTGAEGLLRWRHPTQGLVSPAEFIPVLEDTGMIVAVGAWVRQESLRITRRWRARGQELRLAVNVSARELRQADFMSSYEALLTADGDGRALEVEITESLLMDDIERSIAVLHRLRAIGCRIAIDDFGTGYSSLNYLSRLPADALKIDQTFVARLATDHDTLDLVKNIVALAHSLGLAVVAEGVESEEQASLLRHMGCDELQGFLLGRPLPVADFERSVLA
ncbi:MAG: EAL domain-containing protein [Metallibacterium scheffleri]|jgi:PAS domain S-box-containing protein/diguanylate cyclase (GGDEF)-like protein|uniref:EAL domain-containing protein n=1 Tax=Metallibacterium scheffleri TaxID=993689 RepID=UPI0026EB6C48|nr:EAL domain-containing protein [Metallibacterium scheffleri]MCK9368213.1 EAL domain-containing protein [Metallibacterium scheffleri]